MKSEPTNIGPWLTSAETRKQLHVSGCALMHLREGGKLRFSRSGNAILYFSPDVERLRDAPEGNSADKLHK
jgi:hypothetical protein